jgi:hypothetical protein
VCQRYPKLENYEGIWPIYHNLHYRYKNRQSMSKKGHTQDGMPLALLPVLFWPLTCQFVASEDDESPSDPSEDDEGSDYSKPPTRARSRTRSVIFASHRALPTPRPTPRKATTSIDAVASGSGVTDRAKALLPVLLPRPLPTIQPGHERYGPPPRWAQRISWPSTHPSSVRPTVRPSVYLGTRASVRLNARPSARAKPEPDAIQAFLASLPTPMPHLRPHFRQAGVRTRADLVKFIGDGNRPMVRLVDDLEVLCGPAKLSALDRVMIARAMEALGD